MKKINVCIAVLFLSVLAACGTKTEEETAEPSGVIPERQLQGLEKAKDLEQTLLDAEAERKKIMEEQGL